MHSASVLVKGPLHALGPREAGSLARVGGLPRLQPGFFRCGGRGWLGVGGVGGGDVVLGGLVVPPFNAVTEVGLDEGVVDVAVFQGRLIWLVCVL